MAAYADELKITLRELDLDLSRSKDGGPKIRGRISRLSHLATSLFDEIRNLRTAKMEEEFPRLEQLARDLGAQLGKEIAFTSSGESIEVDRRNLASLSEPLMHIVRNAVDHGIETPEERKKLSKGPKGRISVKAVQENGRVVISIADDGRGIDEEFVRSRFSSEDGVEREPLIRLLSRPGFTTLENATDLSGRGVGLDLVMQRVESVGGHITLETVKGKGTRFTISLPKGPSYSQLLFFRRGQDLYAVQSRTVTEVERTAKSGLKRNADGLIFYRGQPAYAGSVLAEIGNLKTVGSYVIHVSYVDSKACFLADDVLFEHDVQEELLHTGGGRQRLAVRFGSGKREFYYLPPTVITQIPE
jgi:chemotaxis protein histidine kinase CheA